MKRLIPILVLVAAALVAGCAGVPRREGALLDEYLPFAGPPVSEFHFFRPIDGWAVVGRYQLVLWTTPWEAYLITVNSPCEQLWWTTRLEITSTANTVSHFESVLLKDHERCPILEIRPLDLKALKEHRQALRAGAPQPAAAPPPQ
jgi:hypothetical protein